MKTKYEPLKELKKRIEEFYGLDDLSKRTRKQTYIRARQMYYKFCLKEGYNKSEATQSIGLDHATGLNALNRFYEYIHTDKEYRKDYERLCKYIADLSFN